MKKEYIQPTMRVVALKHQTHILAGSPYDDQKSLNVYDTEGDDINDIQGIWWGPRQRSDPRRAPPTAHTDTDIPCTSAGAGDVVVV